MANIFQLSNETYFQHLPLILLFSISFVIAFLIPAFASFPTFNDMGAIFLRTSSVFLNLTPLNSAVIIFSSLFSLLFLAFAIVAINTIVKHSRTHTRITREVRNGLEKYTAKVFLALLLYSLIVVFAGIFVYIYSLPQILPSIIAVVLIPFFFYSPASIVIDEKGVWRSLNASLSIFFSRFEYVFLWFIVSFVILTLFDFIFIALGGTAISRYLMLGFNALFLMPYLVVLQSQAYMARFALLKR